jgi:alpha-N-arabinofuranosidase
MWTAWKQLHPDLVDEHYYMPPAWFLSNTTRYDKYDRNGPKVFAGEYAAQTVGMTSDENRNNWRAAIAEAAFMTGLERNGDVVQMASYAPLMAHADAWQWKPDAIWFDNLRSYGTPNYYVQSVYANNAGTRVIPITPLVADNFYTSATLDERSHELIVKLINNSPETRSATLKLTGAHAMGTVKVVTLASSDLNEENSFEHPKALSPVNSTMQLSSDDLSLELRPYSFTVYRIPVQ